MNIATQILTYLFLGSSILRWRLVQAACDLDCQNGSKCVEGPANFDNHMKYPNGTVLDIHSTLSEDGNHCECSSQWTGVLCNKAFDACDDDNDVNGHKCYHGGVCIHGLEDFYGNGELFCDCTNAKDENGMPYAGKYCEYKAVVKCGSEGVFCTNGGECPTRTETACECSDNVFGPHCEFDGDGHDDDDDDMDDDDTDDDQDMDDDDTDDDQDIDDDEADNDDDKIDDENAKEKQVVPKCTLKCKNGGTCQFGGSPDNQNVHDLDHLYETNTNTTKDFMTCLCTQEFGGKQCDLQKVPCGIHHCYHGGTCLTREVDGVEKHHCDCTSARTGDKSFAGRFCQFESDSFCTKNENHNGQLFCTNGGTCLNDEVKGCSCLPDFYGSACEFKHEPANFTIPDDEVPSVKGVENPKPVEIPPQNTGEGEPLISKPAAAVCNLECFNGGHCKNGVKDLGNTNHLSHIEELQPTYNEDFEHCICRDGYVGLQCEHKIELCPSGAHVCMFGSKCVKYGDEDGCDCEISESDTVLAGKSCEHKSTHPGATMCIKGAVAPVHPRSFCLNNGACKSMITESESHPGCNCVGEWEGPHCEMHKSSHTIATEPPVIKTTSAPVSPPTRSPVKAPTRPPVKAPSISLVSNEDNVPVVVIEEEETNPTTTAIMAVGLVALIVSVIISSYTFIRNRDFQRQILLRDADRRIQLSKSLSNTFSHKRPYRDQIPNEEMENLAPSRGRQTDAGEDEDGHKLHNVDII